MDSKCDVYFLFSNIRLLTYPVEQNIHPQDSTPFLRRVSTEFQKHTLQTLSQIDPGSAFEGNLSHPGVNVTGTRSISGSPQERWRPHPDRSHVLRGPWDSLPISQSPLLNSLPNRPPTIFKFVAAFKTQRSRASSIPEPSRVQGSYHFTITISR